MPSVAFGTKLRVLDLVVAERVVGAHGRAAGSARAARRRRRRRRRGCRRSARRTSAAAAAAASERQRRRRASAYHGQRLRLARARGSLGAWRPEHRRRGARRLARRGAPPGRPSSSPAKAAIVAKRSAGSLASAFATAASSRGEARSGRLLPQRRRRRVDVLHRDRDEVVARERHLAGQQLVENDPERVDVRAARRPAAPGPARARCSRRCRARCRSAVSLSWASSGRAIPKSVTFASPVPFRSTFCGLTSRWTKPCSWAKREPAGDRDRELERAARPAAGRSRADELLQVLAGDVLEDDERAAVVLAPVDHGDDVRVGEAGDELRLPPEAVDDVLLSVRAVRAGP